MCLLNVTDILHLQFSFVWPDAFQVTQVATIVCGRGHECGGSAIWLCRSGSLLGAIILGKVLDCFEPQCPHLYDEKINAYTVKIYANLLN